MKGFEKRLVDEKNALNQKIVKLKTFIADKEIFDTYDIFDQVLLQQQMLAMCEYHTVLKQRIGRLNAELDKLNKEPDPK